MVNTAEGLFKCAESIQKLAESFMKIAESFLKPKGTGKQKKRAEAYEPISPRPLPHMS
jgi:hypothetical protein